MCQYENELPSHYSYLGVGAMEVFDTELGAIGLTLDVTMEKRNILPRYGVKTVAVVTNAQGAFRWTALLEPGPGQPVAGRIN